MQIEQLLEWAEEVKATVVDSPFGKAIMLPGGRMYIVANPDTRMVEIHLRLDVPLSELKLLGNSGRLNIGEWLERVHPIGDWRKENTLKR